MTDRSIQNVGVSYDPESQGYELVDFDPPYHPATSHMEGQSYWACPDCGAVWNADDLHDDDCPRGEADADRT